MQIIRALSLPHQVATSSHTNAPSSQVMYYVRFHLPQIPSQFTHRFHLLLLLCFHTCQVLPPSRVNPNLNYYKSNVLSIMLKDLLQIQPPSQNLLPVIWKSSLFPLITTPQQFIHGSLHTRFTFISYYVYLQIWPSCVQCYLTSVFLPYFSNLAQHLASGSFSINVCEWVRNRWILQCLEEFGEIAFVMDRGPMWSLALIYDLNLLWTNMQTKFIIQLYIFLFLCFIIEI